MNTKFRDMKQLPANTEIQALSNFMHGAVARVVGEKFLTNAIDAASLCKRQLCGVPKEEDATAKKESPKNSGKK